MVKFEIRSHAITIAMLACLTATASAQNWPSFRGPGATGIGTGDPPVKWNVEERKNVKWVTPIPGLAHSSPIIWGDRVYLTTAVSKKKDPELHTGWLQGTGRSPKEAHPWKWKILCLHKATGEILWRKTAHTGVPKAKRHIKSSHANSTPATDGRHVVAFFGSEGLYCYDRSGKLLWSKDLGLLDAGPYNDLTLQWGFASSPIIHDGKVIVQCDTKKAGFWASFDVETGEELRRVARDEVSTWSTPTVHAGPGRTQVICNGYKHMAGYDLDTGAELWKLHGGGDVPVPTPFVAHNLIYITNGHGRRPLFVVRPDATGDLTPGEGDNKPAGLAWWSRKNGSYMPTPIVLGDHLYVGGDNGGLKVGDARSGKLIYIERISRDGATFSASPVAAADRLYFTSEDGHVYVVKAGPRFELLATNDMKEVCMATPAISDGQLFVRTRDRLYCLGR
ncbi:MAG: PQQ-binding-like beta-propeller repeat protein [Planctomycetota bacterium]|nr:PQQ-binding-like beta-propeller repeat protein [Planctomycetota bacterium]